MQVDTIMKKEHIIVSDIRKAEYREHDSNMGGQWYIGEELYTPCNEPQCNWYIPGQIEMLCSTCIRFERLDLYTVLNMEKK